MGVYPRPRFRSEVPARGSDACFLLEFHEGVVGEEAEDGRYAVGFELLCGGTACLGDEELLKRRDLSTAIPKPEVPGEGEGRHRWRRPGNSWGVDPLRCGFFEEGLELGFEGSKEGGGRGKRGGGGSGGSGRAGRN